MAKPYVQLSLPERAQIGILLKDGRSPEAISVPLGRNPGTISRELNRNCGKHGWRAMDAHDKAKARQEYCRNAKEFTADNWALVDSCVREKYSPEQISGGLKVEGTLLISHETIYKHIYADKKAGGDLAMNLRCQKVNRKRYGSGEQRRGVIKDRVSIEARPAIVEERSRIGDWEGDTVIGKDQQGVLVTIMERKSRFTAAHLSPTKHAENVTGIVNALLSPHRDSCHTITFDNGKEFAYHKEIAEYLSAAVYFAHPYHSWERGLNENTNGLLRQYFPKNTNLKLVTDEQVKEAVDQLNNRPRKCLEYKTPNEVFYSWSVSILPRKGKGNCT